MKMQFIISFLFIFTYFHSKAQSFQFLNIPVSQNGVVLKSPWAGGLNAPQWASLDINQDGLNDLYAFDRMGNIHLTFLSESNTANEIKYFYDRSHLSHFPAVQNYVLLRDYNQDGIVDLFANALDENIQGIKVFQGKWIDDHIEFERLLFPDYSTDVLNYIHTDTIVDQVRSWLHVDYPAIDDLDGDGDLDILAVNIDGNKILFYKNIALEKGFTTDTLIYELADDCWGRFGLTPDTNALVTSLDINTCAFFQTPEVIVEKKIHGGTSLCLLDDDNDGDKELLYGDLVNNHIVYGKNNGNTQTAWINEQDTIFPVDNTSIDIPYFPATFHLDINNDGHRDLLASPNQIWKTPDIETAWYYENTGTDEYPVFELNKKNVIADEMLDFGTGANPTFADVNGDGLTDIVSGNREYWTNTQTVSGLFLLLNTGTIDEPSFELVDENWLNLNQYASELNTLYPAFGDLDQDGDLDLLIGDLKGDLHYAENTGGVNAPMEFNSIEFKWKNINVGQVATPCIYDLNKDGLSDLIVGELRGTVNYFPNTGTVVQPDFHPIAEEAPNNFFLGTINTQPANSTVGYSQPQILSYGDSSYLVTGSLRGWIKRYLINEDSLSNGAFELVDEQWGNLREGLTTRIAFSNINNDVYLEAIIGNDRGGLTLFKSPLTEGGFVHQNERLLSTSLDVNIYPNPGQHKLYIQSPNELSIDIYDLWGQLKFSDSDPSYQKAINVSDWQSGTYFIKVKNGQQFKVKKWILLK